MRIVIGQFWVQYYILPYALLNLRSPRIRLTSEIHCLFLYVLLTSISWSVL